MQRFVVSMYDKDATPGNRYVGLVVVRCDSRDAHAAVDRGIEIGLIPARPLSLLVYPINSDEHPEVVDDILPLTPAQQAAGERAHECKCPRCSRDTIELHEIKGDERSA